MEKPLGPQFTLFHGTHSSPIEGGTIKPSDVSGYGAAPGAYASVNDVDLAETYARRGAQREGQLFGTVFEVEPLSDQSTLGLNGGVNTRQVSDPKGLVPRRAVSFPLNNDALPMSEEEWSDRVETTKAIKQEQEQAEMRRQQEPKQDGRMLF